jgi:hypothetical protein
MLVFIKRFVSKRFEWCWKREKVSCKKSGTKRSLFRVRLRLLHAMLDVILIVCLVVFAIAWLVSNDWDCLISLWKNHAFFLLYGSIYLVFSLMHYLGWLGACLQHVWLLQSRHKPLWSFGFWLVMPLYASFNDVLSLCIIMAVIALLVGRSRSFASLRFCTEYELYSCIQFLKTKLFQCVHHTYLLAVCYSKYIWLAFIYPSN